MKSIGICGHIGLSKNLVNGQTIKTKELTNELISLLGEEEVNFVDTHNWRKAPFKLVTRIISLMKNSEQIIMLPAKKGLQIFVPLFSNLNRVYKRKLHYSVIGGWLPDYLQEKKSLIKPLKNFESIFVETQIMKDRLELMGFKNIKLLPNFKNLKILDKPILLSTQPPYKLCLFSRVMKEKGIEDAISAVKKANEINKEKSYHLDVYGPIEMGYKEVFNELQKQHGDFLTYKGVVSYDESVFTIKDYYLLLFPTLFKTEGIPGTVIDAFASGVPVVASDWNSAKEIITQDKTGFIYPFNDVDEFTNILVNLYNNPELVISMKSNCIAEAHKYSSKNVVKELVENHFVFKAK